MIQRLHELQTEEDKSPACPAETAHHLPQDAQVETTQTSNVTADQQDKTEGEDVGEEGESSRPASKASSRPLPQLGSALKNGSSGSSSTRLLPDFVYQASPNSAFRETEDRQGGRGGGGKKRAAKENGRKSKQNPHLASSPSSSRRAEEERKDAGEQPANSTSWSEMSSMVIGSEYRLAPLSPAMEQRLILQYLTPLGDYQEVRLQPHHSCLIPTLRSLSPVFWHW